MTEKELTIEITDRCSLNCPYCSTDASSKGKTFFSLDKIEKIIDKYNDFGTVRLSGGEPFEHPYIDRICRTINNNQRRVKILSCGTYFNEPIPRAFLRDIRNDLDEIIISYHNQNEKIFEKAVCNIISAEIPFSFHALLTKNNYKKMGRFAKNTAIYGAVRRLYSNLDLDINMHILKFVKQGRGRINKNQTLSEEEIEELSERIKKIKHCYPNLNISYSNSFEGKKCDCGSRKAVYTVNDKEIPCSALKKSNARGKFACKYGLSMPEAYF